MAVLLALLALIIIVGAALLLRRRPSAGRLAPAPVDGAVVAVPAGPLGADDLRRVRFPIVVRGYRPADVDALLARLADQLATPDATAQVAGTQDATAQVAATMGASEVGQR